MRSKGKIASWNDDKGFGFVAPNGGGPQVFIHVKAFNNRNRRPAVNDVVTYVLAKDEQGRARAVRAAYEGEKPATGKRRMIRTNRLAVILVFLAAVGGFAYATNVAPLVNIMYAIVSVVAFFAYAIDKYAAQNGRWRISEGLLHFLALAGGWPGAFVAQQTFRHKTQKASFRFVFWVTVLLNCAAFAWLRTPEGRAQLKQLLASFF